MNLITDKEIKYKLNDKNLTASVFKLIKTTGRIFIPQCIEKHGRKYKVISILRNSFSKFKIDQLTFPEDSAVVSFEPNSISKTFIKKIKIPPSLQQLKDGWCDGITGLIDIEVSPRNKFFLYIEDKFLVGKSHEENSQTFDTLYYARYDIKDALIPPQIKTIKQHSFDRHENLKTIIFSESSKLKIIEFSAFSCSSISKLILPPSVEVIDASNFSSLRNLVEIEVMQNCANFLTVDNKFLFKKSSLESEFFDVFVFCGRNVEEVTIPKNVRVIDRCAFQFCKHMESLMFEPKSSLQIIENSAFNSCHGLKSIVIPSSVKFVGQHAFSFIESLQSVVFLSSYVELALVCFNDCINLNVLSFQKAKKIVLNDRDSLRGIPKRARVEVREDAELEGPGFNLIMNQVAYLLEVIDDDDDDEIGEEPSKGGIENDKDEEEMKDSNENDKNEEPVIDESDFLEEEESENDSIEKEKSTKSSSDNASKDQNDESGSEML